MIAGAPPGWIIWPDLMITRRKRFHIVTDPAGDTRFRSRVLLECVRWLEEEGINEYTIYWERPDDVALACRPVDKEGSI